MIYNFISKSEQDTLEFGQNIESEKFNKMVICLKGDLGAGKTVFTKGFANGMGIAEVITSPTFNIIKEYDNVDMPLYHMDMYRLEGNVSDLGLTDYFNKKGVTIIEWADMIEEYLPTHRLDITFSVVDENTRLIVVQPYGKKYEEVCERTL